VSDSIVRYGYEICTVHYRLKKKSLSTEIGFWRRAGRTFKILRVKNKLIKKMRITQTILERIKSKILNGMDKY
jgi:hypothetical protein